MIIKIIKIIILVLIFFSSFSSSSSANIEANAFVCIYNYNSIRTGNNCTQNLINIGPEYNNIDCDDFLKAASSDTGGCGIWNTNPLQDYYNNYDHGTCLEAYSFCKYVKEGSNSAMISSCFDKLSPEFDFVDDIKKGSLEIQANYKYFEEYDYNNPNFYSNEIFEIGCNSDGTLIDNNNNSECSNLFDYLYNKLSTKFPLDIFVPVYNFNAGETACPTIILFGEELKFCAIVMVASAVKYIFLISFIIRSVLAL